MLEKPNREYPEYSNWKNMRARCSAPSIHKSRPQYTNKTVCEEWSSFEQFYRDMGPKPTENHSIDRIDNNGNYEPSNCRWATDTEQNRNKPNRVKIYTYDGITGCLPEIADHANVKIEALRKQLRTKNIENAIKALKSKNITYNGMSMTKKAWAAYLNVKPSTMFARFRTDKPLNEILI